MIQSPSVEGLHRDTEPSTKSTSNVDSSTPDTRTIRDSGTNVEGPALDIEPSAISTSSVEGSTLDTRTVRDIGTNRGGFNT